MTNLTTDTIGHRLVITRELDASRELAWTTWTDPAHIKEWLRLGVMELPEPHPGPAGA